MSTNQNYENSLLLTNYGIFMNFVLIIIKICQNSFLKNFDELSNFDRF